LQRFNSWLNAVSQAVSMTLMAGINATMRGKGGFGLEGELERFTLSL
jgi:hypothetical protein